MRGDWTEWSQHVLKSLDSLSRIEEKLDVLSEHSLRNTLSLEEHVRRTNLLEKKVEHVEAMVVDAEEDIDGLAQHVHKVRWLTSTAMQLLVVVGGLVAMAGTFLSIYSTLTKK